VLCLLSALTKKCSIANSNTKFCDYTIMGVAKGVLGPWSPYLIFILHCQLCKRVMLLLSEHGDVVMETQTECLATYLSFWLFSEQCLATSG